MNLWASKQNMASKWTRSAKDWIKSWFLWRIWNNKMIIHTRIWSLSSTRVSNHRGSSLVIMITLLVLLELEKSRSTIPGLADCATPRCCRQLMNIELWNTNEEDLKMERLMNGHIHAPTTCGQSIKAKISLSYKFNKYQTSHIRLHLQKAPLANEKNRKLQSERGFQAK